jgi:hypothetical protein
MNRPPDVNPAEFQAAMRPEAAHTWISGPDGIGYWVTDPTYGWLGPFPAERQAWDVVDRLTYLEDWNIVQVAYMNGPGPGLL